MICVHIQLLQVLPVWPLLQATPKSLLVFAFRKLCHIHHCSQLGVSQDKRILKSSPTASSRGSKDTSELSKASSLSRHTFKGHFSYTIKLHRAPPSNETLYGFLGVTAFRDFISRGEVEGAMKRHQEGEQERDPVSSQSPHEEQKQISVRDASQGVLLDLHLQKEAEGEVEL